MNKTLHSMTPKSNLMKSRSCPIKSTPSLRAYPALIAHQACCAILALAITAAASLQACTIFVLTDSQRALFCNNEDWSNPATRIWFVPAGKGHMGCGYVGFDNGWAQGGLNTQGLAFDWVAGFQEKWEPGPEMKPVRGNPSQRMLESCATVEEAIAFYQKHREPSFSYAKILIADKTGASVLIGAKDGQLQIEKASQCRGFGYGRRTLEKTLANAPEPTVPRGAAILRACAQEGPYATKYSNIFDLKTGHIFLFTSPDWEHEVKLNLETELAKGAHYYDLPKIRLQLAEAPRPLRHEMKRFLLDEFKPLPDQEPHITKRLQAVLEEARNGAMQAKDYTSEFWKEISPGQKELQADLLRLGRLVSMVLVDRGSEQGQRWYRYRIEFEKTVVLQRIVLDGQDRIALVQSEGAEERISESVNQ